VKVLFVLEDLLTGGAQAHSLDLVRRLEERGFRPEVAVLGSEVAPAMAARTRAPVTLLRQRSLRRPSEWARLASALQAREPELVVAVNQVAGCVAAAARATGRLRAPLAVVFHSTVVASLAGQVRTAGFLAAARASQALVFVSERQRSYWRRRGLGASRVEVIRNGIEPGRGPPVDGAGRARAKVRLDLDPGRPVFGAVAMFRREKNLVQAVEAAATLHGRGRPVQLLLVGDGPTRLELEARTRALGLGKAVRFAGEQAEVAPFLQAMDAGLLCSTSVETSPLFGLELMATGAPLIASRLGGLQELVEDGVDGLLFRPGDLRGLVDRMALCLDPEVRDRLGANALRKVGAFSAETMAERYADLFRDLARAA
jgi:L-malate glycosyltransferase